MKKLRIFLDSDEVLMDFSTPIIEMYNKEYNTNLKFKDLISWDLKECVPENTNIYQFMDKKGFFKELEPFKESVSVLKKLIADGHDVFIATAGWEEVYQDKLDSFKKHFPFLDQHQILLIKRKDVLFGDVILDDGLHNIENSICKNAIIMDKPWNQNSDKPRVKDLNEFYELINKLANE